MRVQDGILKTVKGIPTLIETLSCTLIEPYLHQVNPSIRESLRLLNFNLSLGICMKDGKSRNRDNMDAFLERRAAYITRWTE